MRISHHLFAGALLAVTATLAPEADARKLPDGPPPAQVSDLLACRAITVEADRLACYDKASAAIGEAVAKRDLVVFDREGVRKTKRGLFGFGIPNLGIFGDDDDAVEVSQIDGVIAGVSFNADGGYVFRLEDGTRWTQTDGKAIVLEPKAGDKVVVKKGALSAYLLSVAKQPSVKVRRIQ